MMRDYVSERNRKAKKIWAKTKNLVHDSVNNPRLRPSFYQKVAGNCRRLGKPEFTGQSGDRLFYFAAVGETKKLASRSRFLFRIPPESQGKLTFNAARGSQGKAVHQHATLPLCASIHRASCRNNQKPRMHTNSRVRRDAVLGKHESAFALISVHSRSKQSLPKEKQT